MKKVLVVSTVTTHPVTAGNQRCILDYCQVLMSLGTDVHYLYVQGQTKIDGHEYDEFKAFWGDKLHVYKRSVALELIPRTYALFRGKIAHFNKVDDRYPFGLTKYVKSLQKKEHFDIIVVNYIVLSRLFKSQLDSWKVIFTHDVFSYKKERLGVDKFWFDLKPNDEALGLNRCNEILSIQEKEAIYYQYLCPSLCVRTVYSPFPIARQELTGNSNILFLSGGSPLNLNGINYFINKVFPIVLSQRPDAILVIGGSICRKISVKHSNIKMLGIVDDASEFYKEGDIAINPIYQGTGLKIKTFEALSYGKATIVHPHSADGIYKQDSAPLLIGRTEVEMAQHIINCLNDADLRRTLSLKGIEYIEKLNAYVKEQYSLMLNDSK